MASKRTFARMKKEPKFSTRKQVRCEITGRKRGVYRKFRISRIKPGTRPAGHDPGMRKASW